jgi:hypothetical protein
MGYLRQTAIAAHDMKLLARDVCNDIMAQYDDWADMEHGPSGMEIAMAEIEYQSVGLDPKDAEGDLRKAMREKYAEQKARHEVVV